MSTPSYISALTAPLTNHPNHEAKARIMLEHSLDPNHPNIAKATDRLVTAESSHLHQRLVIFAWTAACLVFVLSFFSYLPMFRVLDHMANLDLLSGEFADHTPNPDQLTAHELLLLGEPGVDRLEQKRRLHLSDPDHPAYYFEYALAWVQEYRDLPPDFLETARRIDPENAYFLYFAAGVIGNDSIERAPNHDTIEPRYYKDVRLPPLPREREFEILDESKFHEAIALLAMAEKLPRVQSYANEMIRKRTRLLPRATYRDFVSTIAYQYSEMSGAMQIRNAADLFSARAEMLSKAGHTDEFIALARQRDAWIKGLAGNRDIGIIDELVYMVTAADTATNFHAAAARLELQELAEFYQKQMNDLHEARENREIRNYYEEDNIDRDRASNITALALPMVGRMLDTRLPIPDSELKPLRRAEHELFSAIATVATAILILLVGLALFLTRFLFSRHIRLPAARIAAAPGANDVMWIILFGVALPIAIFLLATRLTPLGGRDFNLQNYYYIPTAQYAALFIALILAPLVVARWRISRWLAPLGLPNRASWHSLITLDSLFIWVLATYPLVIHLDQPTFVAVILSIPLVILLTLLVVNLFRFIMGTPIKRLAQAATVTAALPAYPIAAIALLALLPLHQSSEKRWIAQETLLRIDPDAPDLGAYEFRVAAQLRKETNTILGLE